MGRRPSRAGSRLVPRTTWSCFCSCSYQAAAGFFGGSHQQLTRHNCGKAASSTATFFRRAPSTAGRLLGEGRFLGRKGRCCGCREMAPEDDVLCLPCWQTASPSEESPTAGAEGSPSRRSHSFHAKCLDRWLLTKAGACPICRCNVRQLARASVAPSPKSAPQPRPPRLPRNARPGARGARSARASRSAESQRALQEMLPVIGGRALLVSRSAQLLQ